MEQRDIDDDRADQSPVNETPLPPRAGHSATSSAADTARKGAGAGIVGLLVAAKVGLLKLLITGGSALLSVVLYAARYGPTFAAGLVALLFCHEMGHWIAYRRKGITPDAMIFVPFLGAAVIARRHPELSDADDVIIALAGPVVGGLAAGVCLLLAYLIPAQGPFLVSLAATGFLLNALNLIPFGPLDGGHVVGALRRMHARRREHAAGPAAAPWGGAYAGIAAVLVVALLGARGSLGDALAEGTALFHVYTPPGAHSEPDGIALGPGGVVWFTERQGNAIGRLDPRTGTMRIFPLPTTGADALRITPGPDGAMWFTESAGDAVGRITPAGRITEYRLPRQGVFAWDIVAGPDHALWFAENQGNSIGRITTGGTVTEIRLPSRRHPSGLAVGPDGALWFMEDDGAWRGLGRLTTAGHLSEYTLPVKGGAPQMLVAGVGGDHHLYATLVKGNAIVRITPGAGGAAPRMERMSLPAPVLPAGQSAGSSYNPYAIAPALGGVWFTEEGFNILGRLGPDSHVGEYYAFGGNNLQNTFPSIIARAPDGTLWFTASDANASNNRIVHLTGVPSEIGNNG